MQIWSVVPWHCFDVAIVSKIYHTNPLLHSAPPTYNQTLNWSLIKSGWAKKCWIHQLPIFSRDWSLNLNCEVFLTSLACKVLNIWAKWLIFFPVYISQLSGFLICLCLSSSFIWFLNADFDMINHIYKDVRQKNITLKAVTVYFTRHYM